jgi:hypothetical protein
MYGADDGWPWTAGSHEHGFGPVRYSGDASFLLNQAFEPPKDRQDAETLRQ